MGTGGGGGGGGSRSAPQGIRIGGRGSGGVWMRVRSAPAKAVSFRGHTQVACPTRPQRITHNVAGLGGREELAHAQRPLEQRAHGRRGAARQAQAAGAVLVSAGRGRVQLHQLPGRREERRQLRGARAAQDAAAHNSCRQRPLAGLAHAFLRARLVARAFRTHRSAHPRSFPDASGHNTWRKPSHLRRVDPVGSGAPPRRRHQRRRHRRRRPAAAAAAAAASGHAARPAQVRARVPQPCMRQGLHAVRCDTGCTVSALRGLVAPCRPFGRIQGPAKPLPWSCASPSMKLASSCPSARPWSAVAFIDSAAASHHAGPGWYLRTTTSRNASRKQAR